MPRSIVFDIETDDLLRGVTKIHCISTYCIETKDSRHFGPNEIDEGLEYLATATTLAGHNVCGYDFPVLKKLYNWSPSSVYEIADTFLIDCMLFPEERHSLEDVAKRLRLKQQKVEHEDWSVYSEEMKIRCDSDVLINTEIYSYYVSCPGYSNLRNALDLEEDTAYVHALQSVKGVKLDIKKGVKLYSELKDKQAYLENKLIGDLPKEVMIVGTSKKGQEDARKKGTTGSASHTKAGKLTKVNERYFCHDDEEYQALLKDEEVILAKIKALDNS